MDTIKIALGEYGTGEIAGPGANPRILQYFQEVGRPEWKSDEIPWCAIFANWVLKQLGKPTAGTGLASAFLTYGTQTNRPVLGDIVVFGTNKPTDPMQHISFYIKTVAGLVYCLGGNQNNEVNIEGFPLQYVSGYRKLPITIAPDDPHNKYNTDTGQLNPKYNPNL